MRFDAHVATAGMVAQTSGLRQAVAKPPTLIWIPPVTFEEGGEDVIDDDHFPAPDISTETSLLEPPSSDFVPDSEESLLVDLLFEAEDDYGNADAVSQAASQVTLIWELPVGRVDL